MTTSTTSTGWTRSPTSSRSRLAIPILTCAGDLVDRPEMYGGHGPPGDIHSGNPSTRFPTAPTHRGRSPARLDVRGVALVSWMPGRVSVKLTLGASSGDGDEQRGQRHRLRCQDVSALSPTLVPSLINQGCSEIGRGAPRPRRAAGQQKTASGGPTQSPKPCLQKLKTPQTSEPAS